MTNNETPNFSAPMSLTDGLGAMHLFGEIDDSKRRPETSPYLTLSKNIGISFLREDNKNLLLLERDIYYPDPSEGLELNKILLSGEKGEWGGQHLELPDNYVTMAQALNDTIGDNTSGRSKKIMQDLFGELGHSLAKVAIEDKKVPREISYKNVIFSRDEHGPKLLPPIEFVPFEPSPINLTQAKKHVAESLYNSLTEGAVNSTQQRNVVEVFRGFVRTFEP